MPLFVEGVSDVWWFGRRSARAAKPRFVQIECWKRLTHQFPRLVEFKLHTLLPKPTTLSLSLLKKNEDEENESTVDLTGFFLAALSLILELIGSARNDNYKANIKCVPLPKYRQFTDASYTTLLIWLKVLCSFCVVDKRLLRWTHAWTWHVRSFVCFSSTPPFLSSDFGLRSFITNFFPRRSQMWPQVPPFSIVTHRFPSRLLWYFRFSNFFISLRGFHQV